VRFRLLGTFELRSDGRAIKLGRRREKLLLALLALEAGRIVAVDRLIELLWEGDEPASAVTSVHSHVARLRAVLQTVPEKPQILRRGTGYALDVAEETVDVHRFRGLVRRADQATDTQERSLLMAEALALWQGPPLADVASDRLRSRICLELDELRVGAIERWLSAELELGHHHQRLPDLAAAAAEFPLRERVLALQMLALHRCGQSADAGEVFAAYRCQAVAQTGLEPGKELRDLQAAILREDPALDPPTGSPAPARAPARGQNGVVPRQLPAVTRHFAGRHTELELLDRLAEAVGEDNAVVVASISGMAGIGKTTLAVHWAHRNGVRFPDGQLYVNLRGFDPVGRPVGVGEAIRGLLDGLGVAPERIPAGLDAQAALYRSILAGRRLLVILDNAANSEQVRPLLPGAASCMAIVTSRKQLTSLLTVEDACPVALDLLAPKEAHELLFGRLGGEGHGVQRRVVDDIIARCAGLPLALAIVAARAATQAAPVLAALADDLARPSHRLDALAAEDTASDLRAVFSWSYHALSEGAARMFRLLGLPAGADISLAAAGSLAGVTQRQAREMLGELTDANLLAEHAKSRYTFHDLLRAYAADQARRLDAPADRQEAMHRLLDHYVHTAHAAALVLSPHRVPLGIAPPRAGVAAEPIGNAGDAVAWMEAEHSALIAAVQHAESSGYDVHAWQLAWTMVTYLERRGLWTDQITVNSAGLAAALRVADPATVARARRLQARAYMHLAEFDKAQAELAHALEIHSGLEDSDGRAETHRMLTLCWEQQGRPREALEHSLAALENFRVTGRPNNIANSLNAIGWCYAQLGEYRLGLEFCEQAVAQWAATDRLGSAAAWDSIGYIQVRLGDHAAAIDAYVRSVSLYREIEDLPGLAECLNDLGDAFRAADDMASARTAWQEALSIYATYDDALADKVRAKIS
jgi:DNA-binding SARP family transcriptional activator/tetratricopeptide (TPR) repeat protein